MRVFRGFVILKPQKPDLKCSPLRSGQYLAEKLFLFCVCRGLRAFLFRFFTGKVATANDSLLALAPCWETNPLRRFAPALPKGEPRLWRARFLPLPVGEVSPKVTERAPPLPCGELPPQRLRGLQIGEARKMLLAKRLAFFRFDFSFGIIKGEQPLIRGSSASKSLVVFWFSFAIKREQSPPGETL